MDLNGRNHGVLKRGVRGTQGREEGALAFPQPGEEPEVNAPPPPRGEPRLKIAGAAHWPGGESQTAVSSSPGRSGQPRRGP